MSQAGQFSYTAPIPGVVYTLTGNSGGAVGPDGSGNIDVVGGLNITTSGNPGDNTLTVNVTGTTEYAVQIGNVSESLTSLALGTDGQVLTSNGAGLPPSFQNAASSITIEGDTGGPLTGDSFTFTGGTTGLTFDGSGTTETLEGVLVVENGGTGDDSFTAYSVICGGTTTTAPLQSVASVGTSGEILTSNGAGALPTFQSAAASSITITGDSGGGLTGDSFTFTGGTTGLTFAGAGTTETIGGTLGVANGGTGDSSLTAYTVLCGGTTSTGAIQSVASVGTSGYVLTSNGASALPTFQASGGGITTIDGDAGSVTGSTVNIIANPNGTLHFSGDGATTLSLATADANENVVIGLDAGPNSGSFNTGLGQNVLSESTGNWNVGIGYNAQITAAVSNSIAIGAITSITTDNTLRIGTATGSGEAELDTTYICGINGTDVGSVASVVSISGDQLGSTTITAGTGITVTPGANTITIAASGGLSWVDVTGSTQAMVENTGYIADNAGLVTLTLPSTAAQGTVMWVAGNGAGGWTIVENAGQSINFGSDSTTVTSGSLSSTQTYDVVQLLCVVANTKWNVITSMGNITIV